MQRLRQAQDPKAIAKDGSLFVTLSNGMANLLDIKFLEL